MKPSLGLYLVAIIAGMLVAVPEATASSRNVDCDKDDSLTKVLASSIGSAATLEINLLGTCYENVTINRDRVRILGDGNTTVVGRFRVFGSDNVFFRDLTITGPGNGLTILNSRVRVIDVRITGNEGTGILLDESASIQMNGGEVSANAASGVYLTGSHAKFSDAQVIGNSGSGIAATSGSTVQIEGGSVSNNEVHGIDMMFNSALSLWGTELSNNGTVEGYGAHFSHGSSGELHFATITANSGEGVEAFANSAISINGGHIFENDHHGVSLGLDTVAELNDVQIYGNVGHGAFLWAASGLFVSGNTNIPPNNAGWSVQCDGKKSSVRVHDPATVAAIDCSEPDF
ncbi:MAG: right-handed parallel beta-helix repeat-containing protein [Gammaproteobacteria bacterium]|nr:right-handed parallel beta-helix repeat-containing protein [Gammaproteobacteria bacterium]